MAKGSIIDILPLEIIEDTIDIIAADDRKADLFSLPNVKACSLACRTFLPRSKHHIFRAIKIHDTPRYIPRFPPENLPLASSFSALLTSNPQIAELVRELHYIFPEIGGSLPHVHPVLETLNKLETFALHSDDGGTLQWWGLNPRSRSIFIRLMHLPSITHLRLGSVTDFPPTLLFPCANLQSVYLDGVTFDEDDVCAMPSRASTFQNIRLRELELRIGPTINDTVSKIAKQVTRNGEPIFDLAGLKRLTASIKCPDQIELACKTLKHAKHVESIHLLIRPSYKLGSDDRATMDHIISLLSPSLETLQYLQLDLQVDAPKQAPLAGIPRALKAIGLNAKHVKSLKILISVNQRVDYVYDVPPQGDECHWQLLEQALVAPGHWPSLKKLELAIAAKGPTRDRDWEFRFSEFLQAQFSRFSRKVVGLELLLSVSS